MKNLKRVCSCVLAILLLMNGFAHSGFAEGLKQVELDRYSQRVTVAADFVRFRSTDSDNYYELYDSSNNLIDSDSGNYYYFDFTDYEGESFKLQHTFFYYTDVSSSGGNYIYTGETKTTTIYISVENAPCSTHAYNNGVVTKSPTCTASGTKTYTCTVCGHTKTESVSSTGHKWSSGTVIIDATCEENGTKKYTCLKCRETKTETIYTQGHNWNSGTVILAATCEADGTMQQTCTRCRETQTFTVPATGHRWNSGTQLADGIFYTCLNDSSHTKTVKEAGVSLKTDWDSDYHDRIAVDVYLDNIYYTSATSFQLTMQYDASVFSVTDSDIKVSDNLERISKLSNGVLSSMTGHDSIFELETNTGTDGEIIIGAYSWIEFGSLSPSFIERVKDMIPEDLPLVTVYLTVDNPALFEKKNTEISVSGRYRAENGDTEYVSDRIVKQGSCVHTWNDGTITQASTCTTSGIKTYICSSCSETKTETLPLDSENHAQCTTYTISATCITPGSEQIVCLDCRDTISRVLPATGHKDADGDGFCDDCSTSCGDKRQPGDIDGDKAVTSADARTCLRVAVGLDVLREADRLVADVDGDKQITSSDARSILRASVGLEDLHTHIMVFIPGVAATCTKTGLTEGSYCSVCNKTFVAQQATDMKPHSYSNGYCTVCGAKKPSSSAVDELISYIKRNGEVNSSGDYYIGNYEYIDDDCYEIEYCVDGETNQMKLKLFMFIDMDRYGNPDNSALVTLYVDPSSNYQDTDILFVWNDDNTSMYASGYINKTTFNKDNKTIYGVEYVDVDTNEQTDFNNLFSSSLNLLFAYAELGLISLEMDTGISIRMADLGFTAY